MKKKDLNINNKFILTSIKNNYTNDCFLKYVITGIKNSTSLKNFIKKEFLIKFNPYNSRKNCVDVSLRILWFFVSGKLINSENEIISNKNEYTEFIKFKKYFFNSFQFNYEISDTRDNINKIFSKTNVYGNNLKFKNKNFKLDLPYGALFHMTTNPSKTIINGYKLENRNIFNSNPNHSFCGIFLEDGFFIIDGQLGHIYNINTLEFLFYASIKSMLNVKYMYNKNQPFNIYGVFDIDTVNEESSNFRNKYYRKLNIL